LNFSENLIKTLKCEQALIEKEKTDLRAQLIDTEQRLECLAYKSRAEYENELDTCRKKHIEYELKFNDKLSEAQRLHTALEQKSRKLAELEQAVGALKSQLTELTAENNKLDEVCKESSNEQIELQRKLCSVLIEKDGILKDLFESSRKYETDMRKQEEHQTKLKQQIEQLRRAVATAAANHNQHAMDPNIQAQLAALVDEKQAYFNEIQTLKTELNKYLKERKLYKEEHKDNKQLKQVINKHLSEIDKLNQAVKDMQETNDFLTTQINNLNQHIFELNNAGGANSSNNKENSIVEDGFELVDPKRHPINKRLAELTANAAGGSSYLGGYSKSLATSTTASALGELDLNSGGSAVSNGEFNGYVTPDRSSMTKPINVPTPSSTVRKQNQCAQQ
jgi:chromosome segregation ATPase